MPETIYIDDEKIDFPATLDFSEGNPLNSYFVDGELHHVHIVYNADQDQK